MSNPSPPKPWERAGAGAASAGTASIMTPAAGTTINNPSTSTSTTDAPALPSRPSTLSSVVNQTASNYAGGYNNGAYGNTASPYGMGGMGGAYGSSYGASPYNRFGSSYGSSMYGGGGYGSSMYGMGGGYGMGGMGGMGGGYGMGGMGGMYGNRMGMDPNNPSLTQSFSNSTQATFQLIESIVGAFGGFAQMLESTYMATHSSFFAMVSVAEQFGNLRQTLGSVLGIFTLMRWLRAGIAKVTGRPPPASSKELTPAKFAKFNGRMPDGSPAPPSPSRKPLIFFALAVFGLPYLMGKLIKTLAKTQEEEARRQMEANGGQMMNGDQPFDPNKLEFCRVLYDFSPDASSGAVQGVDLAVKKGDLVAVLSKSDPMGQPSEWWRCRSRDGRMGYLPAPYLEIITRNPQGQIGNGSPQVSPAGSRAQTMTTTAGGSGANSRASTLTGMNVENLVQPKLPYSEANGTLKPQLVGRPTDISVESFQKSMFNHS